MATSPDYLRLAAFSASPLSDTALDGLRGAVLVADLRYKHLPIVLANASARRCLHQRPDASMVDLPLVRWLAPESEMTVLSLTKGMTESGSSMSCALVWHFADEDRAVMTDIRLLASVSGRRLVMLSFAPGAAPETGFVTAIENLPFDVLMLDGDLKVTYANAKARGSAVSLPNGLMGVSALWLTPTSALQLDVYARALQGCAFRADALEVRTPEGDRRWFDVDLQPLSDGAGISGLVVRSIDVTQRKQLEQEVLDACSRERESIGRDLHDGLGQELTGIALMLKGLASRVQDRCPNEGKSIDEITALVNRSIESARSVAHGLQPIGTEGGLVPALENLARRSRELYGLDVRVKTSPDLNLDDAAENHLYRIAQEALTNAARHGQAHRVDIVLASAGNTFLLSISDDGEGMSEPKSSYTGMGLNIMKYRAGVVGARFEIESREPRGTVVRVIGSDR